MDLQNFAVYFDNELLGNLEGQKFVVSFRGERKWGRREGGGREGGREGGRAGGQAGGRGEEGEVREGGRA